MPAWPPHLDGWDLGPPLDTRHGCQLHAATLVGAAPQVRTLWLRDEANPPEAQAAWLHRVAQARAWTDAPVYVVHAGGVWQGRPWVVTDALRRSHLWTFRTHAAAPAGEFQEFTRQLLYALAWAHRHGFGHGHITARALAVEPGGVYRLVGLGLVDLLDAAPADPRSADLTALATLVRSVAGDVLTPATLAVLDRIDDGERSAVTLLDLLGATPPADAAPSGPQARLGRYILEEQIGSGGMGVVWRARDPELDRTVAVKVHHPSATLATEAIGRFRQEARAAGRLDHPALVRVLDFGSTSGGLFYAMELVDGPDLATLLKEVGRLEPRLAARWTATLARGLAHAHAAGIVHRDLKPANILVERREVPRITDFGLAVTSGDARMTRAGQVVGTPVYMPPEQAAGRVDEIGPRTDIYSLGALLYEMITGRLPFRDGPVAAVIYDLSYNEPTPIRALLPEVPMDLVHIVGRAMAPDPRRRYPTMEAFATDLEHFLVGEPVSARAPSPWTLGLRWLRRNRTLAAGLFGGGLVLLCAGGAWLGIRERATRQQAQAEAIADARFAEVEARIDKASGAEAARLFQELVAMPELQGTRAWTRAWLAEASRRAEAGDPAGERDALGRVWLGARDPAERVLALTRIAGSWREDWRFEEVARTLPPLAAARGNAPPTRAEVELAREVARFRWTRPAEPTATDDAIARLAHQLPLDVDDAELHLLPSGVFLTRDHTRAWTWEGGALRPVPAPPKGATFLTLYREEGSLRAALGWSDRCELARLDRETWVTEATLPVGGLVSADFLDLDGPALLLVAGVGRDVTLAQEQATGWAVTGPLWSPVLNSDYLGALGADLDDDGLHELVVGMGAWSAYDLRVYGLSPAPRLQMRRRLGEVHRPALVRLAGVGPAVAVAVASDYRSNLLFHDSPGEASIQILRVKEGGLEPVRRVRAPFACSEAAGGDVDGDGVDDIVAGCAPDTVLLRQGADGTLDPVVLSDLVMYGAADLDGDERIEILGMRPSDARWVIAGLGTEARAPLPVAALDTVAAPAGLPAAAAAEWDRHATLVAMGLYDAAISRLSSLAEEYPDARAQVLARKAELLTHAGQLREAAQTWRDVPGPVPEPAVAAAVAALDPGVARAFVARGATDTALGEVAAMPTIDLDLRGGLDPHIQIRDPAGVRMDSAAGGLRLRPMGSRELFRAPLEVHGGRVALEVELATEVVEWAGSINVGIESAASHELAASVGITGRGGGGSVRTVATVYGGAVWSELATEAPRTRAADSLRLVLRSTVDPVALRANARVDVGSGKRLFRTDVLRSPRPLEGRYDLVAAGSSGWGSAAVAVAVLRRVVVEGATWAEDAASPATPTELAGFALATDDAAGALRRLEGVDGPAADEIRVHALLDTGDGAAAARVCAGWLSEAPPEAVLRLLRARPEWTLRLLTQRLGPAAFSRAYDAWRTALVQLPEDPDIARDFAAWAEDAPEPVRPGEDWVDMQLQLARVARRSGRLSLAAAIAEHAAEVARDLPKGDEIDRERAMIARETATIATLRGDTAIALAAVRESLELDPAPEALAEILSVDPELAPLRATREWGALVAPYARYGVSARGG